MAGRRHLLRQSAVQSLLGWLTALYIRLVFATSRWRTVGGERPAELRRRGQPFIGALWHGRLLMMPTSWRRDWPIHVLISQHRDGELIARTVGHFGVGTIRGSTARGEREKGGRQALRALLTALRRGESVCITPDGPRGPRMRAGEGIVLLAKRTGAPMLPATFATSRGRLLGSWDRFLVALPFGRGVYIWGEPIAVAADADSDAVERARRALEAELNRITAEADRLCGRVPVEPAEAAPAGHARP